MVCTKCGKNLPDGSAFCQYCGNPIASSDTLEHNEQLQSQTNTIEQNQAEQNIDNANTNQVEQTTEAPRPTYVRPQIPPRPTYVRPQQVQQNSYAQPIQNNFAQPTYTQQPQQVQQNSYAQPIQNQQVQQNSYAQPSQPQQVQQNSYAQPSQPQQVQQNSYAQPQYVRQPIQNNYAQPVQPQPVQNELKCNACGTVQLDTNAKFCSNCGAKIERVSAPAKNRCAVCGNEFIGTFCTQCGTRASQAPQQQAQPTYVRPQQVQQNSYAQPIQNNFAQPTYTQQPQQVQQNNYAQPSQPSYVRPQQIQQNNYAQPVQTQQNSGYSQNNYAPPPPQAPVQRQATGWRKTLSKISVILALSGAVLAFIFTFFIGESSNYNTISNASSSTAKNIYFFFGKAYSEMNNVFNNYGSSLTDISKTAYTLYCVFGTLISITCLVLPIIFAILATVHSIKYLTGKSYNSPIRYCVYTVISFIGCAMLFATLVCGSQSTHSSYQSISVTVTLNEATIAGIVLTLIALLSVISMTIIAKPREYFVKKNVITLCFNAGKILLLAVSCAFVVETMSFIISSNSSSGDIRLNNMQILMLIVSMFSSPYSYNQYQSNANLALVFTIFSLLLNVAIIILLCISLSKAIVNIDKESNNKSLLIDIFNSSASLLCIIMDIIIIIQLQPIMGNNTTGVPVFMIIYLVMSLLVMGVTIAKKIISSKLRY